jgi:hypothetical protein
LQSNNMWRDLIKVNEAASFGVSHDLLFRV